jgi:hypothetical protein
VRGERGRRILAFAPGLDPAVHALDYGAAPYGAVEVLGGRTTTHCMGNPSKVKNAILVWVE